jgi:hypothetical protein
MQVPYSISVSGLDDADTDVLRRLLDQLNSKAHRNRLRRTYYDSKYFLRDFGISIPPSMRSIEAVLGWPAKAVDVLAKRLRPDGFVLPGGSADDLGIREIWDTNRLDLEAPQANTSALLHSCAFATVTLGDVDRGEPRVFVAVRSAEYATGLWNRRLRRLDAGLSIVDADDNGQPTEMVMYLPGRTATLTRDSSGSWTADVRLHNLPRVLMEPLVYQPRLDRPFGSSRLSRPVMTLADAALRTLVRSEVTAEFFSAPQRYAMGADESAFVDASGQPRGAWASIIGRVWAIGRDEDGNIPEVGQFPQTSMQPHTEQLRMLASLFAGETSLPLSSLGIVQDNPSSAEAIHASKEELITEAEWAADTLGAGWRRVMLLALMLRDGLTEVPAEWLRLEMRWRDPSTPSKAAIADAVTKQVASGILPPDSPVTYEQLGYDETTVARLTADRRRFEASQRLDALAAAAARVGGEVAAPGSSEADGGDAS